MKFLIFNGSLKPDAESNTFSVCKMAQLAFEKLGHSCEIVTLRELDYEGSTDDVNDELKPHIMKMFNVVNPADSPGLLWVCLTKLLWTDGQSHGGFTRECCVGPSGRV